MGGKQQLGRAPSCRGWRDAGSSRRSSGRTPLLTGPAGGRRWRQRRPVRGGDLRALERAAAHRGHVLIGCEGRSIPTSAALERRSLRVARAAAALLSSRQSAWRANWCSRLRPDCSTHGPMSPHEHRPVPQQLPCRCSRTHVHWDPAAPCRHASAVLVTMRSAAVELEIKSSMPPARRQASGPALPCIHAMISMCMFRGRACQGTRASGHRGC